MATCFDSAGEFFQKEKVVLTGNPRASEVIGEQNKDILQSLGLSANKKTVLIVGGK